MSASETLRQIAVLINQLADELEGAAPEPDLDDPATDQPPTAPPAPHYPTVERRLGAWIEPMNYSIKGIAERPDAVKFEDAETLYLIKDVFTTRQGSWEASDRRGSMEQWARDAYLKPWGAPDYFDDAGADHHLFGAVIGVDGKLMSGKGIIFWSDGFEQLGVESYDAYTLRNTKDRSGWANIPINNSFVPERGENGAWCWAPLGAAEVICGGGLPANEHVSTFVVWQAVARE